MEAILRRLHNYQTAHGKEPFQEWLRSLRDREGRAKIRIRLNRLEQGNLGKHRALGRGLIELKIDFGPGYRVYLGEDGKRDVVLLWGGDKSTQEADIEKARAYWGDYNA